MAAGRKDILLRAIAGTVKSAQSAPGMKSFSDYASQANAAEASRAKGPTYPGAGKKPTYMRSPFYSNNNDYYNALDKVREARKTWTKDEVFDAYSREQKIRGVDQHAPQEGLKTWGDSVVGEGDENSGWLHDAAHDTLNNWQIQAYGAVNGAQNVGTFLMKWLDPRSWGSSTRAKLHRKAYNNAMQSYDNAYHSKVSPIVDNYANMELRDVEHSPVAMANYGGNATLGMFAGGEVVTAGAGAVAGGISRAIRSGGAAAGSRIGRAVQHAIPAAARAGSWQARTLNAVGRGFSEAGRVVTAPLDAYASLGRATMSPYESLRDGFRVVRHNPIGAIGGAWRNGLPLAMSAGAANNVSNGNYAGALGDVAGYGLYGALPFAAGVGLTAGHMGYNILNPSYSEEEY